ncbi:hypothetical protein Cp1R7AA1_216 [Mesorhizobium phage Cp1R7A-A1]|nr:hypothetical protein Cp1R7AA1_216 [Mesorhizobium phage Cp1R7A-A1]
MNIAGLAKNLMKKTVAISGDAAREVSLVLVSDPVYDVETGTFTTNEELVPLGTAMFGLASDTESAKYGLTVSTNKIVIPTLNWEATGSRYPEAQDRIRIKPSDDDWDVEKVATDSVEASIILFIAQP